LDRILRIAGEGVLDKIVGGPGAVLDQVIEARFGLGLDMQQEITPLKFLSPVGAQDSSQKRNRKGCRPLTEPASEAYNSPQNAWRERWGNMKNLLHTLWRENQGQDIAEYAVMLAVILVIVVGTVRLVGSQANNAFSAVASSLQ